MGRGRVLAVCASLNVVAAGFAPTTFAQELAAAEALFNEGRRLMDAGELERACKKFEESQRLDASAGTALNLASCYEKQGRIASAWAQYSVASRIAQAQGREMVLAEADKKKVELEPRLNWIVLEMEEPAPGVTVFIGDTQLDAAASGSPIPVDAGAQRVVVRAPGYQEYSVELVLNEGEAAQTVTVPPLVASQAETSATEARVPPSTTPPTDDLNEPTGTGHDHTWAYVVGGVGVAAFGTGIALGFAAKSKNDEARELCFGGTTNCPRATIDKADEAQRLATLGTVVGSIGIAGVATGVVLYLLGDADESAQAGRRVRFVASVDGQSSGLFVMGAF